MEERRKFWLIIATTKCDVYFFLDFIISDLKQIFHLNSFKVSSCHW